MTSPIHAVSTSNGRFYEHPGSGKQVPSITNVIGLKDKPALKWWAAKQAAIYAAQNIDMLAKMKTEQERVDVIKGAPFRKTGDSSNVGNQVHDWIDGYAKHYLATGGARDWVPEDLDEANLTAKRMWKQFTYIDGYYDIEWLVSEFTVWSDKHEYAGTGDWIARIGGSVVYGDTKCFVPSTLITMADGTEKTFDQIRCGDFVTAWDGERLVSSRVVTCGENGVQPVVRITTSQGRTLTVTHDHPVLTDTGAVKAGDLTEGALVRVAGAVTTSASNMNADDAYFIGLVLGDGGLSHNNSVRVTTMDPEIVSFLTSYASQRGMKLSKETGFYKAKDRPSKASSYTMTNVDSKPYRNQVSQMFRDMDLMGVKSGSKFIPDAVMSGGREAWIHFLAGYLDTDGHFKHGTNSNSKSWSIQWTSKSEKMLRQCQSLLTALGIRGIVRPITGSLYGVKRDYWQLHVSSRDSLVKLQSIMPERAGRTVDLRTTEIPLLDRRSLVEPEGFDVVKKIEFLSPAPTVYVEIAGTHTHITNGMITWNTGNGVYPEVGMQVAAGAGADYAIDGDGNEYDLPKPEKFAVLHVRPTFTRMSPLTGIPACFKAFLGLRAVFEWHCTDAEQVIGYAPQIKGPR